MAMVQHVMQSVGKDGASGASLPTGIVRLKQELESLFQRIGAPCGMIDFPVLSFCRVALWFKYLI